ncbi:putative cardiolipin synthase (CMP-forming) [Lamellibrachia satsuma]|nr:putative cardiolipin synthase (CMP-forming) [Lamellibrachia satsuma]
MVAASPSARINAGTTEHIQRTKDRVKETVEERVLGFVKKENIVTIPNMLTGLRIAMTPFLGYLVLQQCYPMACIIFIITGITDVLDGWVARTFENQTSAFGSFLDPLADKLLISVLFVTLTMVHLIPLPLTALVIARDVCLITGAFYVRYISIVPPKTLKRYFDVQIATAQLQPTIISKLNTAVQLSLVTFSLCAPVFSFIDHPAMHALWFLTAGTTIASGVGYIFAKDTFKILQQTKKTGL